MRLMTAATLNVGTSTADDRGRLSPTLFTHEPLYGDHHN